jgi:hypothetical protein
VSVEENMNVCFLQPLHPLHRHSGPQVEETTRARNRTILDHMFISRRHQLNKQVKKTWLDLPKRVEAQLKMKLNEDVLSGSFNVLLDCVPVGLL